MIPETRILIVDDEPAIRLTLEDILTRDGHQVITAESGQTALALLETNNFDVALLDLNLGDISGTEVLATLNRHSPDTVTIMLTAYASLETAIAALRQGAHDYLVKPCQIGELRKTIRQGLVKRQQIIRQRSLLRQLGQYFANNMEDIQAFIEEQPNAPLAEDEAGDEPGESVIRYAGLAIDLLRHVITLDGSLLELSPTEFSLLAYLIREAPRVVPAQELVRHVQGYESEPWEASEMVRAHIYHIRQKIEKITGRPTIIRTVRGVGYTVGK
jgi:DNA-binding response OmpR family regulator